MTTARRRRRSPAEQSYWDRLSPRERVAFTIGYALGRGADFPRPDMIDLLRRQLGDDRSMLCTRCARPLPERPAGARGRPPKQCPACRGVAA